MLAFLRMILTMTLYYKKRFLILNRVEVMFFKSSWKQGNIAIPIIFERKYCYTILKLIFFYN